MNTIPTASRPEETKPAVTATPAHEAAPSNPQTGVSLGCLALLGDGRPEPRDELGGISLSADRPGDDEQFHSL